MDYGSGAKKLYAVLEYSTLRPVSPFVHHACHGIIHIDQNSKPVGFTIVHFQASSEFMIRLMNDDRRKRNSHLPAMPVAVYQHTHGHP
jgi:hypothetical protein